MKKKTQRRIILYCREHVGSRLTIHARCFQGRLQKPKLPFWIRDCIGEDLPHQA